MSKVTSKLQVTLPKALADQYNVRPGDEIEWSAAGDCMRVCTAKTARQIDASARLTVFDDATARQRARQAIQRKRVKTTEQDRGWTREELYDRDRTDRH